MAMYQLTPAQEQLLDQIAAGYFVTAAQLSAALTGLSGVGPAVWQTAVISGGTATVSARQGRMTYVKFDTSGLSLEDLDTIAFGSAGLFADGDFLVCGLVSTARNVTLTSAGNAVIKGGTWRMRDTDHTALLIWRGTTWQTVALSPEIAVNTMSRDTQYVDSTDGIGKINLTAQMIDVLEVGAETLAQGEVTITASGGTITLQVDEGAGYYTIGEATDAGTATTAAAALVASINTIGIYSASNILGVVTITAPAGSGASANTYALSLANTGTMASTVTAQMGVTTAGVNGAEINSILYRIIGGADTQTIIIKNAMAANTITFGNTALSTYIKSAQVLAAGERTILQNDNGTWYPFAF